MIAIEWLKENSVVIVYKLILIGIVWVLTKIYVKKFDKWVVKRFWPTLKRLGFTRRKFNMVDDLFDILAYTIAIFLTLYILDLAGIIYTALTAAGVIGIIIGFTVKEIASNMISGILLKLNQPFIEGDSISIDGKYKGTVTRISLYYTDIVDFQGIVTSLPNAYVISKPLINYSKQTERLINITVSVSKDTDIDKALDVLRRIGEGVKNRIEGRQIDVFVNSIQEYKIDLVLRLWVSMNNYGSTKKALIKEIIKEFKKNKIELAVPMRKNI